MKQLNSENEKVSAKYFSKKKEIFINGQIVQRMELYKDCIRFECPFRKFSFK